MSTTPESKPDMLRERNNLIFSNLKECRPRGLGNMIESWELTSYEVTPNSGKFLNAIGKIVVREYDSEGKQKGVKSLNARWNSDGVCLQPVFYNPNGGTRAYNEADLVKIETP